MSETVSFVRKIGEFRLDSANQCLWRGSTAVSLTSKAYSILDYLSKRPDQLVTHNELLDAVWNDTHVQPEVLKVYIFELRKALGDTAQEHKYIETVHRRGYRLLGKIIDHADQPLAVDPFHPFVNRKTELAVLEQHLQRASTGVRQVVFLRGETGIGKTALLNEFLARAAHEPMSWFARGRSVQDTGESEPFSPVLEALTRLIGTDRQHPLVGILRQTAPCWLIQFPNLLDPGERLALQRELTGSTTQRMIREFCTAMDLACADHLLVLALDDLHRSDASTMHLVDALTARNEPARLYLLGTFRTGQREGHMRVRRIVAGLQRRHLCKVIQLSAISATDLQTYVKLRFPHAALNQELADRIYQISSGIPLFFTACLDYLQTQVALLNTPDTWLAGRESVQLANLLPDTLHELMELWLSQLSQEEQLVLEGGSLIGLEFSVWLVSAATELQHGQVEDICSKLVRVGGWLRHSGFNETAPSAMSAEFTFVHELLREGLYGRQTGAERVKRHLRIAQAMEAALGERAAGSASKLAHHFEAGNDCLHGIHYLREAAKNAHRLYSDEEAVALLLRALEITKSIPKPDKDCTEVLILSELGEIYFAKGDFTRSARIWEKTVSRAMSAKRVDVAATALLKSVLPLNSAEATSLRSVAQRVLRLCSDFSNPADKAKMTIRALVADGMATGWRAADSTECRAAVVEVLRGTDPVESASARIFYTWFQLRESAYPDAILAIQESLPVSIEACRFEDELRGALGLAWAFLHVGEWAGMRSVTNNVILSAAKRGNEPLEALFTYFLAWLHVECGAYDLALEFCAGAQRLNENSGSSIAPIIGSAIHGLAELGAGQTEASLARFARLRTIRGIGSDLWFVVSQIGVVESHLARRDFAAGRLAAKALHDDIQGFPEKTWTALALRSCARSAAGSSEWNEAAEHIDEALRLVRTSNLPLASWRVNKSASEIYGGMGRPDVANECHDQGIRDALSLVDSLDPADTLSQVFAQHSGVADRIKTLGSAPSLR